MLGIVWVVTTRNKGCTGIRWAKSKGVAKYQMQARPYNEELSNPKCQYYRHWGHGLDSALGLRRKNKK